MVKPHGYWSDHESLLTRYGVNRRRIAASSHEPNHDDVYNLWTSNSHYHCNSLRRSIFPSASGGILLYPKVLSTDFETIENTGPRNEESVIVSIYHPIFADMTTFSIPLTFRDYSLLFSIYMLTHLQHPFPRDFGRNIDDPLFRLAIKLSGTMLPAS